MPAAIQAELATMSADEQAGLIEAWLLSGDAPSVDMEEQAAAWTALDARTRLSAMPARAPLQLVFSALRSVHARPWAVAAAVLALVAVVFVLGTRDMRISAPVGGPSFTEVILPDGSHVQLSPGSRIQYGRTFGDASRQVILDGEAFFDVVHSDVPFVVNTSAADIEVLGTAFNVRAWSSDEGRAANIYLQRGSVRVASDDFPTMAVRLAPGEATSVIEGTLPTPPRSATEENVLAWRTGGMAFTNARIGDVLDEVGRRYNIRIRAIEDIRLGRISYYRYSTAEADEVVGDIADAAGLRFRRVSDGFEVFIP